MDWVAKYGNESEIEPSPQDLGEGEKARRAYRAAYGREPIGYNLDPQGHVYAYGPEIVQTRREQAANAMMERASPLERGLAAGAAGFARLPAGILQLAGEAIKSQPPPPTETSPLLAPGELYTPYQPPNAIQRLVNVSNETMPSILAVGEAASERLPFGVGMAAEMLGGAASFPLSPGTGSVLGNAVASALTGAGTSGMEYLAPGEDRGTKALIGGVLGGAADLGLSAIGGIFNQGRVNPAELQAMRHPRVEAARQRRIEAAQRESIPLTAAEERNSPTLRAMQMAGQKRSETMGDYYDRFARTDDALDLRMSNFLQNMAGDIDTSGAEFMIQGRANTLLDDAITRRAQHAKRFYDAVRDERALADITDPLAALDRLEADYLPNTPEAKVIQNLRGAVQDESQGGNLREVIRLDNYLKTLRGARNEAARKAREEGQPGMGDLARQLRIYYDSLNEKALEASNFLAQARRAYAEMSPAVDRIRQSALGKIINVKEGEEHLVMNKLFNVSPKIMNGLARQIRGTGGEGDRAMDAAVRAQIEKLMAQAKAEVGDLSEEPNAAIAARIFRSLHARPQVRDTLRAAMTREQRQRFDDLGILAEAIAKGRYNNSDTAFMLQRLEDNTGPIGVLPRILQWARPMERLRETGHRMATDHVARRTARAILENDPDEVDRVLLGGIEWPTGSTARVLGQGAARTATRGDGLFAATR